MPDPLPKWLLIRYAKIWKEKKNAELKYDQIRDLLMEKDDRTLSVILSALRKYGWLETKLDPSDTRRRKYRLRDPNEVMEEILDELAMKS